jgi:hypothetical protein
MSTFCFGSSSRSRFCTEPSDASTLSVTPLRARILRYSCAICMNELSCGPALMVIVRGGAGSTSHTTSHTTTANSSTNGNDVHARSRHKVCVWSRTKCGKCGRNPFMNRLAPMCVIINRSRLAPFCGAPETGAARRPHVVQRPSSFANMVTRTKLRRGLARSKVCLYNSRLR